MQPTKPPRWASRLLEIFCAPHLLEEVQGDLHERFLRNERLFGEKFARRQYGREVLSFLRPFALKRQSNPYSKPLFSTMFRNYLKIAFRNLQRQKAFTSINVVGLAIGLATCVLITLYIQDELSYDRYNQKADRIVRVAINLKLNGEAINSPTIGPTTARDLGNEYPEVLETTRIRNQGGRFVSYGTTSFKEDRVLYSDSTFFQVFTIPFLKGDPRTALTEPNTLVLTEKTARKYFGNANPMGKILTFGSGKVPYRVTGVVGKVPENSHFRFDLLASLAGSKEAQEEGWLGNMNFYTYLVLPENYDYRQLEPKIQRLGEKYIGLGLQKYMGISLKQFREKGNDFGIFLQPLTDIHLHSSFGGGELSPGGDIRYVYVLTAIALFMLLIACVNFMNLSTATASRRSREVGVRKVLGSVKGQLQQQFLMESMLLAVFALVVGLLLVGLTLPVFNQLTGKALTFNLLTDPDVMIGLAVGTVLVGVLAGSYPAFYLASFKPVQVLKGRITTMQNGLNLRSGLVVFQFFISIALIIATVVANRQLRFMQDKKVGFDRDQVLVIHDTYMLRNNEAVFRNQLTQNPQVIRASVSGDVPVGSTSSNNDAIMPKEDQEKGVGCRLYAIDTEYIPTLGMQIVKGRNFSKSFATDSSAVILNETAVKAFGWQQNPIGKELVRNDDGKKYFYRVIGVVSDFHFESLRQKVGPLVMFLGGNYGSIMVKTHTDNLPGLLASLKKQWDSFAPGAPFTYSFLDDRFEQVYRSEQKIGQVLTLFSGLTIFIACLGLFGLATYTAEQRTKEIGIRKVLGASISSIIALLSRDFLKLVLIALVIASPIAWYAMNQWLNDFAYKIDIEWWVFALAGGLAIAIALITVSFQSIRAALMNPVKSLRSE
jgi:putative ABC transport system permease protein